MAVRTSMVTLVSQLKNLTDLTRISSIKTEAEFSDEDVQRYLDLNKVEYQLVPLSATPVRAGSTVIYRNYYLPEYLGQFFEQPIDDTINDFFFLQDSLFSPILFGSGDAKAVFDPYLRRIVFNDSTQGNYYYLTVQAYDLYGAAADMWNIKASRRTALVTIKTDNHSINMEQEYQHCLDRFTYYKNLSNKSKTVHMVRDDQTFIDEDQLQIIKGFAPIDSIAGL